MVVRLHALAVLAADPKRQAAFWGDLLGRSRDGAALVPDASATFRLEFVHSDEPKTGLDTLHQLATEFACRFAEEVAIDRHNL